MLTNPTLANLSSLRLHGFSKGYQEQQESRSFENMSFNDRFSLLVDREVSERHSAALARRLANARFKQQACLEDVKVSPLRGVDKQLINQLQTCQWANHGQNILITGPSGVGKTFFATALAHKACQNGHTSRYFRTNRLTSEIAESKVEGKYKRTLEKLGKVKVLILDDWLLSGISEEEQKDIFELIDERNSKTSTVITSQNPVCEWHKLMPNAAIADALLDRLVHTAHRIELKGESLRKQVGKKIDKEE